MSFWGELKRRNVYKIGVAYAIVAWLLIQFAAIAFPHLDFPSWAVPFVIIILIIGFPVVLIIAWAFEVTPDGIKRTKQVPLAESITYLTGKKLNYIVIGLLVLAVAYIVFDKVYIDRRATEPEMEATEAEQAPTVANVEESLKTIAVLPFVNLSSDAEQEYFVDGLSEEIINSLTQIPNLGVTGRTSSFTFKGSNKKTQEIANELGVENILEGSVRKAGNSLRITAQLVRAADDLHLWSKTYDRELKDIFEVQEDIATAVANELKVTLGIDESLKQLGGTDNLQAYEHYLAAKGKFNSVISSFSELEEKTIDSMESIEAALTQDPKFALAWAFKAQLQFFLAENFVPSNLVSEESDAALHSAMRAIELEPNLAVAYGMLGKYRSSSGDWIEAELAFRKALELTNEPTSDMTVIAQHYLNVGYFKRAHELLDAARRNDPLQQDLRGAYVLSLGLLGDMQGAEEEHQSCKELFEDMFGPSSIPITYLRLDSDHVLSRDEILDSDLIDDAAKEHLDSPKEGLEELRRIYSDHDNLSNSNFADMSMWAAYFGDPEFAMDAMERSVSIEPSRTDVSVLWTIWPPHMREVRKLPRFKKFIKKIGLVDYWNEFGWPDICHKLDNGDFECD